MKGRKTYRPGVICADGVTIIYTQITRSVILHLEDALAIGKVRVFLISYKRGQGASATAAHYLDIEDVRVLASDLSGGRLPEKFIDFKGSVNGQEGKPLSRVLKLEDRGDKQRAPIVLQVANGPGQVVGEGAVKPAGKPDVEIAITSTELSTGLLTRWQARRLRPRLAPARLRHHRPGRRAPPRARIAGGPGFVDVL